MLKIIEMIKSGKGVIIAVAAPKGGVSKTTLIFHLCYLFAKEFGNDNVILVDADTANRSSSIWNSIRSQNKELMPWLVTQNEGDMDFIQSLDLLARKYKIVLVDVGGDNDTELHGVMIKAHKLYVPTQPSYMDTFGLGKMDSDIRKAKSAWNPKLEVFLVPSVVSPNNMMVADEIKEIQELAEGLENMTLTRSVIKQRKAYRRCVKYGKVIFELTEEEKYDPKGVAEMTGFYEEVKNG